MTLAEASGCNGSWKGDLRTKDGNGFSIVVTITQDGNTASGKVRLVGKDPWEGTFKDGKINKDGSITLSSRLTGSTNEFNMKLKLSGTRNGDIIEGTGETVLHKALFDVEANRFPDDLTIASQ